MPKAPVEGRRRPGGPRPRRVVLMAIDSDAGAAVVRRTHLSFAVIPGVRCVTAAGTSSTVGDEPASFSHVSLFEFDDASARQRYHEHPMHQGARDLVRAHLSSVLVLDLD